MRAPLTVSLLEQEPLVLSQQWYAERVTLANDGDEETLLLSSSGQSHSATKK